MCREVDDAIIFEGTLEKISIIISKLEEFQSNR
jgi:hypothetical protein